MAFSYNSTGIQMGGGFEPIKTGTYYMEILATEEGISAKGKNPMVKVTMGVIDDPMLYGKKIVHYVTFMDKNKPGAWMSVHFLKTIGEPWEGDFIVDPKRWIGRRLEAYVIEEDYEGKKTNKVKTLKPYGKPKEVEQVPF